MTKDHRANVLRSTVRSRTPTGQYSGRNHMLSHIPFQADELETKIRAARRSGVAGSEAEGLTLADVERLLAAHYRQQAITMTCELLEMDAQADLLTGFLQAVTGVEDDKRVNELSSEYLRQARQRRAPESGRTGPQK